MIKVLYTDDEPALLEIGKLFLEQSGEILVETAISAIEGLRLLEDHTFDAIVSDYQMPGMDGITFLKHLKASGNTTPFIIFTGRGREEVVIEALNGGADFYIQKGGEPLSQFAELIHKIKIAVGRKRAGDAQLQDEIRVQTLLTFYQMTSVPLKELMTFAIEKTVEISTSSIGYLAFVNDDETTLTMYAWSAQAMKECATREKPIEYPLRTTGLWGEAVRQRRPVITNDYAAKNTLKKGHPQGHVPIIRHMNLPVFDGDRIVMVAGVGNKTSDYDQRDVQELSLLMSGLWNVIKQRRAEEELLTKNEELGASYEQLASAEEELRAKIDELTRQELVLRESRRQLDAMAANIPGIVYRFIVNPDGTYGFDYISERSRQVIGIENDPATFFARMTEGIIPEDRERFLSSIQHAIHTKTLWEFEGQYVKPSRKRIWISAISSPVMEDNLLIFDGVIFDNTARKHAEEELLKKNEELGASYEQLAAAGEELRANLDELTRQEREVRESEERYRQFFKTTLDSVFITTADGRWVDCNDALVEIFGYDSREDVFSRPVSAFYAHPEDRAAFLKIVERDGYVKEYPLPWRKKDGTIVDGLITIVPQRNPDGSVKGFLGTVHDVTGKKRVSAPLSPREPFNQDRVENLPDYIVVYDPDGKILYVNPSVVSALGYDADTMIGTSILSYVAEESQNRAHENMTAHDEMGIIPMYEIDLIARDGFRRTVIVKGTQILYNNNPATLLLLIDMTLRKVLEDQLTARAAELSRISTAFRQANKKLMLLSSITRHDITNQLTVILGFLGLLENTQSDPELNEIFLKVIHAARRISSMIQFTKEYEEIGVSDPTWQDISTVVYIAAKQAPLGQVLLKNDIPAGTEVFADPLIAKVCYNLMDNAVRYGGKITTIRFAVEDNNGDLNLICEDDGDGVASDEKKRIFDRGFGKNTGLGLALSREILSITGISIRETGTPGKGARFEMTVPKGIWRTTGKEP